MRHCDFYYDCAPGIKSVYEIPVELHLIYMYIYRRDNELIFPVSKEVCAATLMNSITLSVQSLGMDILK